MFRLKDRHEHVLGMLVLLLADLTNCCAQNYIRDGIPGVRFYLIKLFGQLLVVQFFQCLIAEKKVNHSVELIK